MKTYLRLFWYGAWRGAVIGTIYSTVAVTVSAICWRSGMDNDVNMFLSVICGQLSVITMGALTSHHWFKYQTAMRSQLQSHTLSGLASIVPRS